MIPAYLCARQSVGMLAGADDPLIEKIYVLALIEATVGFFLWQKGNPRLGSAIAVVGGVSGLVGWSMARPAAPAPTPTVTV